MPADRVAFWKKKEFKFRGRFNSLLPKIEKEVQNPFDIGSPWTKYEVFKLIVLAPLGLVRLLLALAAGVAAFAAACVVTIGFPMTHDENNCHYHEVPFTGWRRKLICLLYVPITRCLLWCFGFWRIRIRDMRKDRSKCPNVVVAACHMSALDQFFIYYALPPMLGAVGDGKIFKAPIVWRLGAATQGIFFDVKSKESRAAVKKVLARRADPDQWSGWPTLIFPEGRVTNGKLLIQFNAGAFAAGKPVLPVSLSYPYEHFNPAGHSVTNGGTFAWPLRMVTQVYNCCEVVVHDVYTPEDAHKENPRLFADNVRSEIARQLRLEGTQHSYEDAAFFQKALGKNVSDAKFELKHIKKRFDFDADGMNQLLLEFSRIDTNTDGRIDREEFLDFIRSAQAETGRADTSHEGQMEYLMAFFDLFDTDNSEDLDIKEFIQMSAMFAGASDIHDQRLKLAFRLFDKDDRGYVEAELIELPDILSPGEKIDEKRFCDLLREHKQADFVVEKALRLSSTDLLAGPLRNSTPKRTVT